MSIFETIRTALESITANKLRAALTMLGVIIGVAAVVTLLALGAGVQTYISSQITKSGTNLVTVSNQFGPQGATVGLTNKDVAALSDKSKVPDVDAVVPMVQGDLQMTVDTNTDNQAVHGTTPNYFTVRDTAVVLGEPFTQQDVDDRNRVVVIGPTLDQELFPNQNPLNQTMLIGSVPFKVIGVTEMKGSNSGPGGSTDVEAFVPFTVAQEKLFVKRSGGYNSVNNITLEASGAGKSTDVVNEATLAVRGTHNIVPGQKDDFRILDQSAQIVTLNTIVSTLTAFLGAIGAISLIVGGIGIMNIMLVSVTERTREIGIRMAIGARRRDILAQFLLEAVIVSVLGCVIGIGLGVGGAMLATEFTGIYAEVTPWSVGLAFAVAAAIGVFFGFYPARKAAWLKPIDALRFQ